MTATLQSGVTAWTFQDLVEAILDSHDLERTGLQERRARAAALQAYRELPQRHPWSYYYRQRLLQTVASYDTGTVDFDYTGGTYELQLTLTTGTWPSWAEYGTVIIDDVHYDVDERKSSTVLTLTSASNPGADVAAGTAYEIYRSAYPLPTDFAQVNQLWDLDGNYPIFHVDEGPQHEGKVYALRDPDVPLHYTIRGSGKFLSQREIIFGPAPSSARTYSLFYRAQPRPLAIDEYANGVVATTSGDATVTGTDTVFPLNCAGSIIRFGPGIAKPSSVLGAVSGADNPPVFQDVIRSRTSDTALELMTAAPSSLTGVGFVISDPLDIDSNVMLTALQRMAEAEFSRRAGRQDAPTREALAQKALIWAMENDVPVENRRGPTLYDTIRRAPVTNSP